MVKRFLTDVIVRFLGIGGATADAANPLSVRGPGALFDGNTTGHQIRVNKAALTDTGSFLFQTGFSGRAEFGLVGGDDFELKVSGDGSAFTQALVVDGTTGTVNIKQGVNVGTSLNLSATSALLTSNRQDIRLEASGGQNVFRGLDGWTNAFSDGAVSTYFQTGRVRGSTVFSSQFGAPYDRIAYFYSGGMLLTSGNTGLAPPKAYFEIRPNGVATVLAVNTNGTVGVNTATPAHTFDVNGGANVSSYIGVNATGDTTNRLAVKAAATSLDHDGNGHQIKVNKAATADTASFVFQTNYSTRAEFGTIGSDKFALKVSPDGASFKTSLEIDQSTGVTKAVQPFELSQYSRTALPVGASAFLIYVYDAVTGAGPAYHDGGSWKMVRNDMAP